MRNRNIVAGYLLFALGMSRLQVFIHGQLHVTVTPSILDSVPGFAWLCAYHEAHHRDPSTNFAFDGSCRRLAHRICQVVKVKPC